MKITKIEKQKNNKRYSIFIDDEFAFGIDEVDLLFYKLKENEVICGEKYDYITNKLLLKRAKDKALKYLSYKMRSKKQVIQKLQQYDFSPDIIKKVINVLEKYNYINDEEFAKAFIKYKSNLKEYGKLKIIYELKLLGIDETIFKKYLDDINYIDEVQKAKQLLFKKLKKDKVLNISYKEKQKYYSYLYRRGFSYDTINTVFSNIWEDFFYE